MTATALAMDTEPRVPPRATAFGALVNYICHADPKHFQPANITFDLLQPLDEHTRRRIRDKKQRHALVCERALAALDAWLLEAALPVCHDAAAR
jgi:methylenetetrahydrofolate--tRNA-(uracil-5-)-methyltransferase